MYQVKLLMVLHSLEEDPKSFPRFIVFYHGLFFLGGSPETRECHYSFPVWRLWLINILRSIPAKWWRGRTRQDSLRLLSFFGSMAKGNIFWDSGRNCNCFLLVVFHIPDLSAGHMEPGCSWVSEGWHEGWNRVSSLSQCWKGNAHFWVWKDFSRTKICRLRLDSPRKRGGWVLLMYG